MTPDPDLLVALSPGEEWQENPFHLRSKTLQRRMKDGLLVPAEVLFEGVREATRAWPSSARWANG